MSRNSINSSSRSRRGLLLAVAVVLMASVGTCAAVTTGKAGDTVAVPSRQGQNPASEARMQWWREAKFGMFIHWGVYSVPAGIYQGQQSKHIGEWIMRDFNIPVAQYAGYASRFNPTNFDAGQWVALAKAAGMRYIVITAKHHDGFAMFHTRVDGFNIYDATPWHHDPLAELAAACRRDGIRLGFYYSEAQDWHHPGGAAANKHPEADVDDSHHWDKAQEGSMDDYLANVAVPQVRELVSDYGPGVPAILWWDTPVGMTAERVKQFQELLKSKPEIITNNRLDEHHLTGDYQTPEQKIPANGLPGDWETCMTINSTWGYKSFDFNWKSTKTIIRNLTDIASKGGNYLLNVGPTGSGDIPQPEVERLEQVGAWMKVNGVAIYGTTRSPLKSLPAWGRVTQKGNLLFLSVWDWPMDGKIVVPGLKDGIGSAELLATGAKLRADAGTDSVTVYLPMIAPDKISSTVVLRLNSVSGIDR